MGENLFLYWNRSGLWHTYVIHHGRTREKRVKGAVKYISCIVGSNNIGEGSIKMKHCLAKLVQFHLVLNIHLLEFLSLTQSTLTYSEQRWTNSLTKHVPVRLLKQASSQAKARTFIMYKPSTLTHSLS